MPSDRLYDSRYRSRRRTNPLVPIVGLLVVVLVTGGIVIGGGALIGGALSAAVDPGRSPAPGTSADPVTAAGRTPSPTSGTATDGTGPIPTRRPRASQGASVADPSPDGSPLAEEVGGIEVGDPATDPSAAPTPDRTPRPWADLRPRPKRGPFQMDIYKAGAMATEATPAWCVPAAMLTMLNIVKDRKPITTTAEEQRLYNLARRHSTDKLTGLGAEPEGWAEGLNREGIGPYIVHIAYSRAKAIKEAARALRLTGRPVGLLAWRGAHSMVLTGFKATADPAWTDDYEVTDVTIADVWWPRVSSIWGVSLPPGTTETVARLAEDYLPWRRPDVTYPDKDGNYILVLPVRDDGRYNPSKGR